MALVLSDRIKETTTTTGTSTYTLAGAKSGFESFTANLSNSDTTYYCCTDGTDFEVGLGTFTSSGTTLARTSIISSSNSNNAVSWSSGTRDIFCTLPGSKAVVLDANGALSTGITVQDEGSGLSTTATTLNFVGSGIVASGTGATKTITVTGGGIGTSTANYFDAHTSSDSSALTSSFATIDFDTIRYNSSGSVFSESAGEVTMTTTGIHRIHTDVTTKITSGSSRSDCEIELQRKPSGGSFSQIAGTTAITYNRNTTQGEQTSSIDILYNVTSGDAFRVVAKRQGGSDTIVIQGGAARFNISSVGANPSVATTAADDLTAGDAAVNLTTTSGNITIDAQGSDTDIILKGTDGSSDTTFLTLDGSDAGTATFNNKVVATGGIELPQTSGTAIKTTGSLPSADLGVVRASAGTDSNDTHGFTIKYMGSRSGNNNSYSLFMDNQSGTDVEAMTVLQDGKVGINNTSPSAPLDVSGDAEITGTLTAGTLTAGTLAGTLSTAAQPNITSLGNLNTLTVDDITINSSTISDSGDMLIDIGGNLSLDANGGNFKFKDNVTEFLRISNSSSDAIIRPVQDAKDIIFQQRDGTEVARVEDNGTFNVVTDKLAINGTAITSTAAEINKLAGATGTVITTGNSDTPTTTTSSGDADFVLVDDGGTMKKITPSNLGITSGGASKGFAVAMAIAL